MGTHLISPRFLAFPDESGFLSACVDAQAGPLHSNKPYSKCLYLSPFSIFEIKRRTKSMNYSITVK